MEKIKVGPSGNSLAFELAGLKGTENSAYWVKEKGLDSVTDKKAYQFLGLLEIGGLSATVRRKMGEDIEGACGQLRRRHLDGQGG